jgi:hypothetical protein
MKYLETEFSRELSELLMKHKKTLTADKSGMYAIDDETGTKVIMGESETASEDDRPKMFFIRGVISPGALG